MTSAEPWNERWTTSLPPTSRSRRSPGCETDGVALSGSDRPSSQSRSPPWRSGGWRERCGTCPRNDRRPRRRRPSRRSRSGSRITPSPVGVEPTLTYWEVEQEVIRSLPNESPTRTRVVSIRFIPANTHRGTGSTWEFPFDTWLVRYEGDPFLMCFAYCQGWAGGIVQIADARGTRANRLRRYERSPEARLYGPIPGGEGASSESGGSASV